jgi:hypothetical protein
MPNQLPTTGVIDGKPYTRIGNQLRIGGSRSWRNNNAGNCRYSTVGYDASYLPVLKDDKGFAVFRDYATGWRYLKNLVKLRIAVHPDWTLLDFFKVYAPDSDGNNPKQYAATVAKKLGVDASFKIKNISA